MTNLEYLDLRPADLEILAITNVPTPFDVILEEESTGNELDVSVYDTFKMYIRKRPNAEPLAEVTGTRTYNVVNFVIDEDLIGVHYYNIIYSHTTPPPIPLAPLAGMINFQNTQR